MYSLGRSLKVATSVSVVDAPIGGGGGGGGGAHCAKVGRGSLPSLLSKLPGP
jgi:hypothetical protein